MRPRLVDLLASLVGHDLAALLAPGFFTMAALACLAATLLLVRQVRREGGDVGDALGVAMALYVGALGGGIVIPAVYDTAARLVTTGSFDLRFAGMTSWAGFVGGLFGAWLAVRRIPGLTWPHFLDLSAAPMGLACSFARLGCFLAGCDHGRVSALPWAMTFPRGSSAWRQHVAAGWVPATRDASLPVHPSQLYEALLGLALCALALWLARPVRAARLFPGARFLVVAAGYAAVRIGLEALRGDRARGTLGPVSTGQALGALTLAVCAALWWRWRGRVSVAG